MANSMMLDSMRLAIHTEKQLIAQYEQELAHDYEPHWEGYHKQGLLKQARTRLKKLQQDLYTFEQEDYTMDCVIEALGEHEYTPLREEIKEVPIVLRTLLFYRSWVFPKNHELHRKNHWVETHYYSNNTVIYPFPYHATIIISETIDQHNGHLIPIIHKFNDTEFVGAPVSMELFDHISSTAHYIDTSELKRILTINNIHILKRHIERAKYNPTDTDLTCQEVKEFIQQLTLEQPPL